MCNYFNKSLLLFISQNLLTIGIATSCMIFKYILNIVGYSNFDVRGVFQNSTTCEVIAPWPDMCNSPFECATLFCNVSRSYDYVAFQYDYMTFDCDSFNIVDYIPYIIGMTLCLISIIIYLIEKISKKNYILSIVFHILGSATILSVMIIDLLRGYLIIEVISVLSILACGLIVTIIYIVNERTKSHKFETDLFVTE